MMIDQKTLTQTDLSARWDCSIRTVKRDIKRFALNPVEIKGRLQLFAEADVEQMERKRTSERLAQNGYKAASGIVTVKQAKKLAGRVAR
jgi:transcriptional antiterminator